MNAQFSLPAFFTLLVSFMFAGCNAATTGRDASLIDFYETPLECNAAPEIGCGSRSKPVLLGLQKETLIAEAWLNRSGTVIAVVWKKSATAAQAKDAVADTIFARHKLKASKVSDERRAELLENFGAEKVWYRGREVDRLSIEEAGIIAGRIAGMIEEHHPLEATLRTEIIQRVEAVFTKWFTDDHLAARIHGADGEQANREMEQELIAVCSEVLGRDAVLHIMQRMGYPQGDEVEEVR